MQTASFSRTIETILYIMAFYYVFKFLARLFLPLIVKKVVEKASQNFQNQYQSQHSKSKNNEEVIVDIHKKTKPSASKKIGEYVDFEEIE